MDAIIFDFDGVLVDSEPLHLRTFRQVLAPENVELTEEAYFDHYLGYDDRDAFAAVGLDNGREFTAEEITRFIQRKTLLMQELLAGAAAMPGAVDLVSAMAENGTPLAVCSGALRQEVLLACKAIGVLDCFRAVVCADEVTRSKPDPESYCLALRRLRESGVDPLRPRCCVAVEDSPAGIESALANDMNVLAVTTSCPADGLQRASRVVDSLADVSPADLEALLQ